MHDAVEAITGETAAEVKGSAAEKAGEVALVEAEKEVLVGQQETEMMEKIVGRMGKIVSSTDGVRGVFTDNAKNKTAAFVEEQVMVSVLLSNPTDFGSPAPAEKEVLDQQETTAEKVVAEAAEEAMEVEEAGIIGSVRAKCCDFIEPYLIIFIYPDGEYKSTG